MWLQALTIVALFYHMSYKTEKQRIVMFRQVRAAQSAERFPAALLSESPV